jgi:hypothetical protein
VRCIWINALHVEAVVELFQVFLAFRLKNWNSLRWILLH